jgi:ABC-type ATPase involved in cell division
MIELERVRVDHPRGGQPLLDEATTVVQRGEVVILGASTGAGASLLLAAILGDHPLADGKVALFGRDLSRLRRASLLRLRRRVGVVPQDLRLLGEATALTNVLLPLDIDHVPRHAATIRAAEALARVGLAAELDVRVDRLSMAERQRVALARALVREPSIVVLDQPTSHQDPERAFTIAKVLSEVAAAGATVLVASRDPVMWEVAAAEGWRTLALRDGKMVETTAPRAVVDALSAEIVIEADVIDSEPVPALATITPISAAIAAAEAAEAVPNVVQFPITARSRGQR